jgi:hypothetical protein
MHRGRPIGEAFDHRSPGGIGQSRKCCTQSIHNHMVVDFQNVSRINFVTPDFCFLISIGEWKIANALIDAA